MNSFKEMPEILKNLDFIADPVENSKGTILYCHSFMGSYQNKNQLRKHYNEYSYFAINLPGQGESPIQRPSDIELGYSMRIMLAFIDYFELNDIIMIGHSHGGGIIAKLNEIMPEKIKLNILEAPASGATRYNYEIIKCLIPKTLDEAYLLMNALYCDPKSVFGSHYDLYIKEDFKQTEARFGVFRPLIKLETLIAEGDYFDGGYKSIKKPTLIILGAHDGILPPQQTISHIQKLNKRILFVVVPDCAHLIFHQQMNKFYALCDTFIKKHNKIN
ncbi:alpha/beta fold hydrolase [[Mycoplasma] testudinis]|uniref:alpha/beta fold hydrolase n=1 Tax=[Mycoplasma] testudinis TaxID=33924 RepID=UPI0004843EF6|nr:alpha/beta hydrolase [[Mycoplasma] testudinis]